MPFSTGGEIYSHDISEAQAGVGTAYVKLETFATQGEYYGCLADPDRNQITCQSAGFYHVVFSISFSGSAGTTWEFDLAVNDTVLQKGTTRKTVLVTEVGATTFSSIVRLNYGDVVSVYVKADGAGKTITVQNCSLTMMS